MIDAALDLLWRQSLLLSLGCLAMLMLRPLLLRHAGAQAAYLTWSLIPSLMLTAALPRPAQAPLHVVLHASTLPQMVRAVATASAASDLPRQWLLALWLAGALTVALTQWRRQQRFLATIDARDGRLPAASSPALLGLWRGRLLLPLDFEQRFTAQEQRLILAHEAVHGRRHDNAWNVLACALCALHWFNPLAWAAWRRMRADQELSCDAAVLCEHPEQTAAYARALAKTVAMNSAFAVTARPWHSHHHPLVERVAMLKLHTTRRTLGTRLTAVLIALATGAAYAVQGDAATDPKVEIMLTVRQKDGTVVARPRLIAALGMPATVRFGEGPSAWQIEMTTTALADGRLKVHSQVSTGVPPGDKLVSDTQSISDGAATPHSDTNAVTTSATGAVTLSGELVLYSPAIANSPLAIDRSVRLLK